MATISAFFSNFTLPTSNPSKNISTSNTCVLFNSQNHWRNRHFQLPASASSFSMPLDVDYLVREFSSQGVSFESVGGSCVVKMRMDNGSVASLLLPSGLITSYKPQMWHGDTVEVLHTIVSEGKGGEAVIQGGVSMDFKCGSDGGLPWSPGYWALTDIKGSSETSIQVELKSVNVVDMVEINCQVTLKRDLLGSELTVANNSSSSVQFLGSFLNHLKVSTPDATYAVGTQGSNYRNKRPALSEFSIIPPNSNERGSTVSDESWVPKALQGLVSVGEMENEDDDASQDEIVEEEVEGEEKDDYSQLTEKMCRIYTSAPRNFTLVDRGRRNSLVVQRSGFDEFYVYSPGSQHEWYGRYAYVCIGPSATLAPIVLGPGDVWEGAQYLYNPSL